MNSSLSSTASLDQFLSANERSSLDGSISQRFQDEQAVIIQNGKQIEDFIKRWGKSHKPNTCFKLLQILFDLFTSEVNANLSLRQALLSHRSNAKLSQKYREQMDTLFGIAHEFDPKLNSLEEIISFFKSNGILSQNIKVADVNSAKSHLQQLVSQHDELMVESNQLQQNLDTITRESEEKLEQQKQHYQKIAEEERRLKSILDDMKQEKEELQSTLEVQIEENSPKKLRSTIATIDAKLNELQAKIQILNQRHNHKIDKYQAKISQYRTDIEKLTVTRNSMEVQLDQIHKKIDLLMNPLADCVDPSVSPHAARVQLAQLTQELNEKQQELQDKTEEIEQMEIDIAALQSTVQSFDQRISRETQKYESMNQEYLKRESELKQLKQKKDVLDGCSHKLRDLDDNNRFLTAENLKLKSDLEHLKNKSRQLAIDNNSMTKTLEMIETETQQLRESTHTQKLSRKELSAFEEVMSAFRSIREALDLPSESTPSQITQAVLYKV